MANLLRHFKGQGCQIPAVKNLEERDAYVEMMVKTGQVKDFWTAFDMEFRLVFDSIRVLFFILIFFFSLSLLPTR